MRMGLFCILHWHIKRIGLSFGLKSDMLYMTEAFYVGKGALFAYLSPYTQVLTKDGNVITV